MFKKLFITTILLTILTGMLFASADLFLKKKIQIEDAFRNNLNLDQDYYKIWVGNRDDVDPNSKYRIEDKSSTKEQKKYIPGLPTAPSSSKKDKSSSYQAYSHSYKVEIFLDESYNDQALKNSMDKLIKTDIWPELNHCDQCITFEILKFYKPGTQTASGTNQEKIIDEKLAEAEALSQELRAQILALEESEIQRKKEAEEKAAQRSKEEAAKKDEKIEELESAAAAVEEKEKALEAEATEREQQRLENKFIEYEAKIKELTDANIALDATAEILDYDKKTAEGALADQEIANLNEKIGDLKETAQQSAYNQFLEMQIDAHKKELQLLKDFKNDQFQQQADQLENYLERELNPIVGCMEEKAKNYNSSANISCEDCCRYKESDGQYIKGCDDREASNYNPAVTEPCEDCCKYNANLGGQESNNGSDGGGWMMWTLFGLVLVLIILSIFTMLGNKKKVVYLKPKNNNNDKNQNNNAEESTATPQPVMPPTTAPIDEGVLQSEIQTQRQSAVAMSAGQKEGATQILKDWLDESKNDDENNSEG